MCKALSGLIRCSMCVWHTSFMMLNTRHSAKYIVLVEPYMQIMQKVKRLVLVLGYIYVIILYQFYFHVIISLLQSDIDQTWLLNQPLHCPIVLEVILDLNWRFSSMFLWPGIIMVVIGVHSSSVKFSNLLLLFLKV